MALRSRLIMSDQHTLTLRDGSPVYLCDLRTRFRLDHHNIYTHFSLEDIERYKMKVHTETYTSMFPREALESEERFFSLFRSFCKWSSEDEPILLHEEGAFLVDKRYPEVIKGIAISVWVPDISHRSTMEVWACKCLLECNQQLLSIAHLKNDALQRVEKMGLKKYEEKIKPLLYWQSVREREIRLIKTLGSFAELSDLLGKN